LGYKLRSSLQQFVTFGFFFLHILGEFLESNSRMAGGFITTGPSKNYPGKLTFRVFITCLVAAFGGLIFGYDLGI